MIQTDSAWTTQLRFLKCFIPVVLLSHIYFVTTRSHATLQYNQWDKFRTIPSHHQALSVQELSIKTFDYNNAWYLILSLKKIIAAYKKIDKRIYLDFVHLYLLLILYLNIYLFYLFIVATRCRLDGPGIESRLGRDFPHASRPALGLTQPPMQWVPGLSRG
jgi:hypothetical protein